MNTKYFLGSLLLGLGFAAVASSLEARENSHKFGFGYRQATATWIHDDAARSAERVQVNGIEASLGLGSDVAVGAYWGMERNMHFMMVGPKVRYDFNRLITRDTFVWQYLNFFTEVAVLAKFGGEAKGGVCIHAPDIGFEIMPFSNNGFAILTSAGFVLDFGSRSRANITQGMFGDVGVKYYF